MRVKSECIANCESVVFEVFYGVDFGIVDDGGVKCCRKVISGISLRLSCRRFSSHRLVKRDREF